MDPRTRGIISASMRGLWAASHALLQEALSSGLLEMLARVDLCGEYSL